MSSFLTNFGLVEKKSCTPNKKEFISDPSKLLLVFACTKMYSTSKKLFFSIKSSISSVVSIS